MDNNNPSASSGQGKFSNGFLLGFLLGAAVVFLLGTKKGKRLLKAISEEGIDNISNILEEADKSVDLDEVMEDEKPSSAKAASFADLPSAEGSIKARVATKTESEGQREDFTPKKQFALKEKYIEEKPKVRRFFRGVSRRVN